MISDAALRVIAASGLDARVATLVPNAGLASRTLGVKHALRPTSGVRVTEVIRHARARSDAACVNFARGVRTAWRRLTGVAWRFHGRRGRGRYKMSE